MGRLTHPHIVSIFDIGEQDGSPYIIQELMGGGDVEGLLEDADEPPSLAKALEIGIAVCLGLEYAHEQGVVHRDLKPGNVWLTADGTPKIGDFGLAVDLGRSRLTQHGMMVGTLGYMPPEQALGGEVTPQADLYSLGAMLYELVTGRTPFQGDTPTAVIFPAPQCSPVSPLVQVGRAWGAVHGVGTGATPEVAGELVRLFPALREAIPDLVEPERVETEASQFRLFDAYSQFMRAQSRETPWVVVLDDLHWADKPTLRLLQYVARELADMGARGGHLPRHRAGAYASPLRGSGGGVGYEGRLPRHHLGEQESCGRTETRAQVQGTPWPRLLRRGGRSPLLRQGGGAARRHARTTRPWTRLYAFRRNHSQPEARRASHPLGPSPEFTDSVKPASLAISGNQFLSQAHHSLSGKERGPKTQLPASASEHEGLAMVSIPLTSSLGVLTTEV